jgi:glycosyltransferase involved in cell wall biosynthesis
MLRGEPVDVLHAFLFHSNLMARLVGPVARVPAVVVSERSVECTKKPWRVWTDRLTWRLADQWTANSREVARVLRQRERIDASRIETIPNGIDLAYFSERVSPAKFRSRMGFGPTDRIVLCIGRLDPLKGQPMLLHAFRQVATAEPHARLCLVGDGRLRETLMGQVEELELQGRVVFTGSISDVRPALASAELLALASTDEGLPGVVMEAQAAGLPVVATAAGGTPELVQHERTGLLVPIRDSSALSTAIVRLLRDRDLARRLAEGGRASVQDLSSDRMVEATLEMYQRLLARTARARLVVAA